MNLTRDEARERALAVRVASYDVTLDLTTGESTFASTTVIRFTAAEPGGSTWVDLVAPTVREVTLNGRALDSAAVFDGVRLTLDGLAADNELRVMADCAYMRTGEGLHRFVDPVDGETYLYTQFEVADSRRMYAVLEQPDLKATFAFSVTAPAHWQVLSNSPTPQPVPDPDREGVATWRFAPTPRVSSYITALVAGPYAQARGEYVAGERRVPLGVFCRRSLAEHLDAEAILDVTRAGFGFFERTFDYPYPFAKYDQVFVPEFNAGAMENAGCVTFLEDYVFRSRVPDAVVERRAETILHELAHMWFGDLVTMTWWDDLWLNESFATYASVLCMAEATRWSGAWTTFANTEKTWAYRQDQLPSSHPISADIGDLEDVEVNFDGITYAKGASVLKQLVAWVGREQFLEGVRRYFRAHEWGNTELPDLLGQLEATSGRDLKAWSAEWLETAGVNTVRPELEVDEQGRFTAFTVVQEAQSERPTLRSHRLAIGLYDRVARGGDGRDGADGADGADGSNSADSADGGGHALVRRDRIELDVAGARTDVPQLLGVRRPDVVLLNDDDLAYAKIRLDERSLQAVLDGIADFDASLPRSLCWAAAWDMTRDAEMAASDYVPLVLRGIGRETDSSVISTLLAQAAVTVALYVAPEHRPAAEAQLADGLQRLTRAAAPGSDAQLQFVRALAAAARDQEQLAVVRGLLEGSEVLDGLPVDTDLRWHLLHRLVAAGAIGDADAQIDAELQRDRTATGEQRAARVRAARPTAAAKEQAWQLAVERTDVPNAIQTSVISGFAAANQRELLRPYVERYFAAIADVWASRTNETAQNIAVGLYPTLLADAELLARSDAWLAEPDHPAALRRLVTEARDGVARALRAQERDRQR